MKVRLLRQAMKTYCLERETYIRRPLREVFEFFSRPENLARITPPRLGFRMLTPSPIPMMPGALIDYTIRVMGFRVGWRTRISAYDPPHRFVDEQVRGPYAFWRHTHTFSERDGGTVIRDRVEYGMPLGAIGSAVRRLTVRRQLEQIFDFRGGAIAKLFEGAGLEGRVSGDTGNTTHQE